jgi:hypothetical protein
MKLRTAIKLFFMIVLVTAGAVRSSSQQRTNAPAPRPTPTATSENKIDLKGNFDGSTYSNKVLKFTLKVPAGWQVQDEAVTKQHADETAKEAEKLINESAASRDSVAPSTLLLVMARPREGKATPTLFATAEYTKDVVRTPREYLIAARSLAGNSLLLFSDHVAEEKINGVEFASMEAVPKDPKLNFKQRYYSALRQNYVISLVMTYQGDEELKWCLEVLNALKFE